MKPNSLKCPGPCENKRRVGQLVCLRCWRSMPRSPRAELFRCWKDAQSNLADEGRWQRYLQARRVALVSLRGTS